MSPFQSLNPIGKLIFLAFCGSAIVIGLACVVPFVIGWIAMMATAFVGVMNLLFYFRGDVQPGPVCPGVVGLKAGGFRDGLEATCGAIRGDLGLPLPDFIVSAVYEWAPVFGLATITAVCFAMAAVLYVVARILTVIGVSIADPSYFETIATIRGRR